MQRHRLLGTRGCNPIGAWSELTAASILHRGERSTDDPCTLHRQSQVRAVCECLRRGNRSIVAGDGNIVLRATSAINGHPCDPLTDNGAIWHHGVCVADFRSLPSHDKQFVECLRLSPRPDA